VSFVIRRRWQADSQMQQKQTASERERCKLLARIGAKGFRISLLVHLLLFVSLLSIDCKNDKLVQQQIKEQFDLFEKPISGYE
jgi:hypothetical protein